MVRASTTLSISTENTMPALPAARVRATLSQIICERMSRGTAPMARRMPISTVRSRTVTIIMLLTPTAQASSVPMTAPMLFMVGIRQALAIRFTAAPQHTLFTKIVSRFCGSTTCVRITFANPIMISVNASGAISTPEYRKSSP